MHGDSSFIEIVDNQSRTIQDMFSSRWSANARIVSAEQETVHGSTFILVETGHTSSAVYELYEFNRTKSWSMKSSLPAYIQNVCECLQLIRQLRNCLTPRVDVQVSGTNVELERIVSDGALSYSQLAATVKLNITAMEFRRRSTGDVFFWGSALLMSREFGTFCTILYTGEQIVSFSSSLQNGGFSFVSSTCVNMMLYMRFSKTRADHGEQYALLRHNI